jgi:hypothetical protein
LYKQRQEWLNDTLKTEPKPYLRIALALVRRAGHILGEINLIPID